MNIITLTLSPAVDVYLDCPHFAPLRENLAHPVARMAGGKGINISRALHSAGVHSTALVVLGRENGEPFLQELRRGGGDVLPLWTEGRIRENITLRSTAGETRISLPGFAADGELLDRLEAQLLPLIQQDSILTLTGRLPEGITPGDMLPLLRRLSARGARLVIDSNSFDLEDMARAGAWLIKPNEQEICEYIGERVTDLTAALAVAKKLHHKGIDNVMISLGEQGAALCCPEGAFCAAAPRVEVVSTVGAGDSAIAGFISAYSRGESKEQALYTAIAFGSAACMREGTLPPRPEDISAILQHFV